MTRILAVVAIALMISSIGAEEFIVTFGDPIAVRYAWGMNPYGRNLLYNKEGIPASPFRTDDWPLFDPDAEIVTVEKPAAPASKNSIDWQRQMANQ